MTDASGIAPGLCGGELPEQLAALNRTNINVQLMAIEAARTKKKDAVTRQLCFGPHVAYIYG